MASHERNLMIGVRYVGEKGILVVTKTSKRRCITTSSVFNLIWSMH